MKMKLENLVLDDVLRARSSLDPIAVHRLVQAYEAGARFPPMTVEAGTRRLVDGWTRRAAYERLGLTVIEVIQKRYASEAELFADAIRLNVSHGEPLSSYDLKCAIARLEELGIKRESISEIVRIPAARIDEMVRGSGVGASGSAVPLKYGLGHLAGQQLTQQQQGALKHYGGQSAAYYVNQLILLLEQDLWPRNQPNFANGMTKLCGLWTAILEADRKVA